jgi:hypothetical protein
MKLAAAASITLLAVAGLAADARSDAFLRALTQALAANDRAAVAAMVSYPITVHATGVTIPVNSAAELTRMFDVVFTPALRCSIEMSAPGPKGEAARRPPAMTGDGVSIANALTARAAGGTLKITAITVAQSTSRAAAAPLAPQRVMFRASVGSRTVTVSGRLGAAQIDPWIVALNKGESAEARIEGFSGAGATVRFVATNASTAAPLRPGLAPRSARIVASERSDYRLEVVRLASSCDPDITYRMIVTVR